MLFFKKLTLVHEKDVKAGITFWIQPCIICLTLLKKNILWNLCSFLKAILTYLRSACIRHLNLHFFLLQPLTKTLLFSLAHHALEVFTCLVRGTVKFFCAFHTKARRIMALHCWRTVIFMASFAFAIHTIGFLFWTTY